jgi:acylglycerol lipase
MQHTTGTLKTSRGITLHTETWLPEGEPHAVIIVSHGLGEHIGRYAHVAEKAVGAGYVVYGLDHQGHGKSEGARAYFERFDDTVDDLKQFFDGAKAAHPGKKIFLYGHSLGSLIALVFTLSYQRELTGLITSGAPLEVESNEPALLISLAGVLNSIIPKAAVTTLPTKYLSTDPNLVRAYETDPLVHHGNVRVRTGHQIVQYSRMVKSRLAEFTLPMLILHGAEDKICPPAGSEKLYQGAGSSDKTLKIYPGMYHEIHNEVEQAIVVNDIITWLQAH